MGDSFGQKYENVKNIVSLEKRRDILSYLANSFGGREGRPCTYVLYSGLHPLERDRKDPENYLVLSASTAELRPFFLTSPVFDSGDYESDNPQEIEGRVLNRIDQYLAYLLKDVDITPSSNIIYSLRNLFTLDEDNKRVYDDFNGLIKIINEIGLSWVAKNLFFDDRETFRSKRKVYGLRKFEGDKEYWIGGILIKSPRYGYPIPSHFGYYVIDEN